jgi:putative nucleotidyltransferase with HDIG domain
MGTSTAGDRWLKPDLVGNGANGTGQSEDAGSAVWVGVALEATLRARAPGLHASTPMVRELAAKVGRELRLDAQSFALLDLSVRVRDVGMVALPDSVVFATARPSPAEWELMHRHPVIGAELLEVLTVVSVAAPVVRSHHERWDGAGYPDGLSGDGIPLLSRVIAICDSFVAMANDRPHRRGIGSEAALERVCQERDSQFDPHIVDALVAAVHGRPVPRRSAAGKRMVHLVSEPPARRPAGGSWEELTGVIAEFDVVPAFAPALERVLAAISTPDGPRAELVAGIESDTGLTVAVLRRAQTVAARRPIANVPDAIATLSLDEIEQAIKALPRAEFPWRTSPLEVLLHRSRVHAQGVMRAADRIARELGLMERDDVLVAALLHDIGKLVLGRADPDYTELINARTSNPEQRIREEQRALRMDHAKLGGLLLCRWGLSDRLADTVAGHHSSEDENEVATHVRLADMVAHHGQGDAVDRRKMIRLCHVCGLSVSALKDVLFDLPHSGGSYRRRAEPSPLSARQTEVLRSLAEGKASKTIALELGISSSTARNHLHNTYDKLGVNDRTHAVLRATEMGWI